MRATGLGFRYNFVTLLIEERHEEMIDDSPLGKSVAYTDQYSPGLLYPVPRGKDRERLGVKGPLPFTGHDLWHAYELSWLNPKGRPVVALGSFRFPATSPYLIESKSLKLYLNSLNGMQYDSDEAVAMLIKKDLSRATESTVEVHLTTDPSHVSTVIHQLPGTCIDGIDVEISDYQVNPAALVENTKIATEVEETLHSQLLKSNCPVTGQPDWASLLIRYRGIRIDRAGLLKYIVSYRHHQEFHESCVERIFLDLLHYCRPDTLTVSAHYTRRGGLDINPFRTNFEEPPAIDHSRLWRQ